MIVGSINREDSRYPVWPYRLDQDWPLAQYAQGIYPGDPRAGNIGVNPAITTPIPNTTNLTYEPPKVGDFNRAPSDIFFNLPRIDSANDWWRLPGTGLESLHSNFTWSCWVRITDDNQVRSCVLGSDSGFSSGTGLYLEESASPHFRFYRGAWDDVAFSGTWNGYDKWHHLVVVNDGGDTGTDRIYMNGVRGTDNVARTLLAVRKTEEIRIGTVGTGASAPTNRLPKAQVAHVVLLNKVVTDSEAYSLFAPSTRFSMYEQVGRRKWFLPSTSFSTYTISPSGGVVLGNTNPLTFTDTVEITPSGGVLISGTNSITSQNFFNITNSGGIVLGGNNTIIFSNGATNYTIVPSGGVVLSGNNSFQSENSFTITPDGGVVLGGSNGIALSRSYAMVSSGGVDLSGSNTFVITKIVVMNGGVVFQGSSPINSNTVEVSTRLPLLGVGK